MSFNFNDFNFEVIDITAQGGAELIVNRNSLNFSKKIADGLGNPPFVRTMLDKEKKIFAIQACKQNDSNAVKFSKPHGEQKGGVVIMSTAIIRILRTCMKDEWDQMHRYKIPAKLFPDSKAAVFYMETATQHELYNLNRMMKKS